MAARFKHKDITHLLVCVPGIIAFPVYWRTLAPTLQVADAGEQIAAAHFLGVSHPTGTPLYLLLMKGWELIFPFGSVAWRMNFLNVLLSTVTLVVLSSLILRLSRYAGAPSGRGLFLAATLPSVLSFSQSYWYESLAASSYVLHYLFVVLWLAIFSRLVISKQHGGLKYLYLVTGLALTNHVLSLVLLVMVMGYSLSLAIRKEIAFREFVITCLFLLPGLSLYLYIPLRAASGPPLNWGRPDSFGRFLHYITRRDHVANLFVSDIKDFMDVGVFHIKSFFLDFSPALPFFALASGLAVIWTMRKERLGGEPPKTLQAIFPLALSGVCLFVVNLALLSLHGSHLDLFFLKRYMVPGYIGLFFSCAVIIVSYLASCRRGAFLWAIPLLVLMPMGGLYYHYENNDRSQNRLLDAYVKQLLAHLPEGAAFYAVGDNHLFPLLYYHLVEGNRPDLILINPVVGLGDNAQLVAFMKEGRLYTSHYVKPEKGFRCLPRGLVFHLARDADPPGVLPWGNFREEAIRLARAPLEKILLAEYFYRRSVYHEGRHEQVERLYWIRRMEAVAGGYDQTLMLTGRAFSRAGMGAESIRYLEAALQVNPKNRVARFLLDRERESAGGGQGD